MRQHKVAAELRREVVRERARERFTNGQSTLDRIAFWFGFVIALACGILFILAVLDVI